MAEYIDRNAFGNRMYHEAFEKDSDMQKWDSGCWIRYKLFEKVLRDTPSADVQPVRHGYWTETTEPCGWTDEDCAECSECHNTFVLGEYTIGDVRELFRYCPNCGARMDEGSSNV